MSRTLTMGLAAALLLTNGAWLYWAIDSSVTIDHHATEVKRQKARVDLLRALLVDYPREVDAATAYQRLRERYPDQLVKVSGDTIELGGMEFEHDRAGLHRVTVF